MARYIDADAFKRELIIEASLIHAKKRKKLDFPSLVARVLDEMPTADVVPKSEVEKQERKQEVMLLDAIDTFRNLLCIESYVDYEDTRKHYVVNIDDVNRIHAELKKKYTEQKNG